jgi:molybdenum cofactor biosynthesis protein A
MNAVCHPHISQESPASGGLVDSRGRRITYIRLAVTDRCNLRCRYCMPENGIPYVPHDQILNFEELHRLTRIFATLGVTKVRVTGGEPFVRQGIVPFLRELTAIAGITALHITTNGVAVAEHLPALRQMGLAGINLSLDTLRAERFRTISRRDEFAKVHRTLTAILDQGIPLKINAVALAGINTDELADLAGLARDQPLTVRFLEPMPFNGTSQLPGATWHRGQILDELRHHFPELTEHNQIGSSTAKLYSIPGFRGRIGIIASYSRQFCHSCNKVRVTPQGMLKTCLYDQGVLDLRQMLRGGARDEEIGEAIRLCVQNRYWDGHAAEAAMVGANKHSMAAIGG